MVLGIPATLSNVKVNKYENIPTSFKRKKKTSEICLKKINSNFWSIEFNLTCLNKLHI